ncbi:MAG: cytidylate kinase family protein, partial [Gemmataceae bacterium]
PSARASWAVAAPRAAESARRRAGFLLGRETTRHLRVVADQADRGRYLSQWLRLPAEQAERTLAEADRRREDFLHRHFGRAFVDPVTYDATLNTSRLGEEGASGVALQAFLCRFPAPVSQRDAT